MTEKMKAKMRHNVERIKYYRDKKTGATDRIPGWARDPHGVPPGHTQYSAPRPHGAQQASSRTYSRADQNYNKWHQNYSNQRAEQADNASERAKRNAERAWEDFKRTTSRARSRPFKAPKVPKIHPLIHIGVGIGAIGLGAYLAAQQGRSDKGKTHKKHVGPRKPSVHQPTL